MDENEKILRAKIREMMSEMFNVSESDLLVRAGVDWNEVKPKFLEKVNNLVAKIDDDKYDNAEDLIGSVITMLKMWKSKIKKGKEMVDKTANTETLDEDYEDDGEYIQQPKQEPKERQQKNKVIRHILHKQGKEKKYSKSELDKLSIEKLQSISNSLKGNIRKL